MTHPSPATLAARDELARLYAAPTCPNGGQPDGRGRCVYQPAGMTCAWPARIVRIGRVALCWRPAPGAVQP